MPVVASCPGGDRVESPPRFIFPGLLKKSDSISDPPYPDVASDRERRFRANYVGCCELKPRYSVIDLNDAVEELNQVSLTEPGHR